MTSHEGVYANMAIAEAFGLDPHRIRKGGVKITLTADGPIVEVEYFVLDSNGRRFAIDDEVVTVLKHYKLVAIEGDEA